jgi:hypothetical protein
MSYLLRLDLDRVRRNLSNTTTRLMNDDELYRELARRGVWRHNDEWWGGTEAALRYFREGEVVTKVGQGDDPLAG